MKGDMWNISQFVSSEGARLPVAAFNYTAVDSVYDWGGAQCRIYFCVDWYFCIYWSIKKLMFYGQFDAMVLGTAIAIPSLHRINQKNIFDNLL